MGPYRPASRAQALGWRMLLAPQQPQEVRNRTVVYSASKGMFVAKDGKEAPFTVVMEPAVIRLFNINCWVTMIAESAWEGT